MIKVTVMGAGTWGMGIALLLNNNGHDVTVIEMSDVVAAEGEKLDVAPEAVHKYTLVVWLEGDDPDCTNELMGGHLGFEMNMSLLEETLE